VPKALRARRVNRSASGGQPQQVPASKSLRRLEAQLAQLRAKMQSAAESAGLAGGHFTR
jgi:hypothetical protein